MFTAGLGIERGEALKQWGDAQSRAAFALNALSQEGALSPKSLLGLELGFADDMVLKNSMGQEVTAHPDMVWFGAAKNTKGNFVSGEDLIYTDFKTNTSGHLSPENVI